MFATDVSQADHIAALDDINSHYGRCCEIHFLGARIKFSFRLRQEHCTNSNDFEDYQQAPNLIDLINDTSDCLLSYTNLPASRPTTAPVQRKTHVSLSSNTLTPMAVTSLVYDAHKFLKPLAKRQTENYSNLEPLRGVLPKADFHSFLENAFDKVRNTEMTAEQL
jgi:Rad3-related DNA helicase